MSLRDSIYICEISFWGVLYLDYDKSIIKVHIRYNFNVYSALLLGYPERAMWNIINLCMIVSHQSKAPFPSKINCSCCMK